MDVLERIKRGYRAMGPGAPRDLLAMFHQEQLDPPHWVIDESGHLYATHEVVATDLYVGGMPEQWEVIGVELRVWDVHEKKSRLVVGGRFRTRLRGSWEIIPTPFIHVWSFADGQVKAVFDYFSGIELRRLEDARRDRGLGLRILDALLLRHHAGAMG